MAYKSISFHIRGTAPGILMHNPRMADPLDPFAKELKRLTKRKNRTEEQENEISRVEWEGSFYYDDKIGPYIPGWNIVAMFIEAAKKKKLGKDVKAAVISAEEKWPLIYTGPRKVPEMWAKGYWLRRSMKMGTKRIIRTRPLFKDWELKFTLEYMPQIMDHDTIGDLANDAAMIIGLLDSRPNYGRFEVVSVK